MIAAFELHLIAIPFTQLLIQLPFLLPEDTADLLGDHHQRLECLLYSPSHSLEKAIRAEHILPPLKSALEELLPNLVCSHIKPQADSLERQGSRLHSHPVMAGMEIGMDDLVELGDKLRVKDWSGLGCLHGVDGRMMPQPELQQIQEDLLTGYIWIVKIAGLGIPVLAQLGADLLAEDGELIELLLSLVVEQVELGVVVNLMLVRPLALAG